MAFFGGDDDQRRRLEAQLNQKDRHIFNIESALQKIRTELEHAKQERDNQKHTIREQDMKRCNLEGQLEKQNKEFKQRNEMCVSLQNQIAHLKRDRMEVDIQCKEMSGKCAVLNEHLQQEKGQVQGLKTEITRLTSICQAAEKKSIEMTDSYSLEIQKLTAALQSKESELQAASKAGLRFETTQSGTTNTTVLSPHTVKGRLQQTEQLLAKLECKNGELNAARSEIGRLQRDLDAFNDVKMKCGVLENEVRVLRENVRVLEGHGHENVHIKKVAGELEERNRELELGVREMKQKAEGASEWERLAKDLQEKCKVADSIVEELHRTKSELENRSKEVQMLRGRLSSVTDEGTALFGKLGQMQAQMEQAKDAFKTKDAMLENERSSTLAERKRAGDIYKMLQECQQQLAQTQSQLSGYKVKDQRTSSVVNGFEERITEMKREVLERESQAVMLDKDVKHAQAEAVRFHEELQVRNSELFGAKREVSRLQCLLEDIKKASGGPNLAVSQADVMDLESKYGEKVRELEAELANERRGHDQTRQQLKEEHMRFEQQMAEMASQKELKGDQNQAEQDMEFASPMATPMSKATQSSHYVTPPSTRYSTPAASMTNSAATFRTAGSNRTYDIPPSPINSTYLTPAESPHPGFGRRVTPFPATPTSRVYENQGQQGIGRNAIGTPVQGLTVNGNLENVVPGRTPGAVEASDRKAAHPFSSANVNFPADG